MGVEYRQYRTEPEALRNENAAEAEGRVSAGALRTSGWDETHLALPASMLSTAFWASASEYFSIRQRTPAALAKSMVSSLSLGVPEGQPRTVRRFWIRVTERVQRHVRQAPLRRDSQQGTYEERLRPREWPRAGEGCLRA